MGKLTLTNYKGDEVLSTWVNIHVAEFLAAQEIVREKIRNGHLMFDKDKMEKVSELGNSEEYILIEQIQGG
jgi:hypothetical protein